jgi:hypothetical protein
MKNQNIVYIRVLLVVLAVVVLLAFVNRSPQRVAKDPWLPSSFNPVGAGNMAFFQTLQELNWPAERWREPLSRLSNFGTGNTLIITRSRQGAPVSFSAQEIDLLSDWVSQGNTLVLFGALGEWDDTRAMMAEFGFGAMEKSNSVSSFLKPLDSNNDEGIEVEPPPGSGRAGMLILPASEALPLSLPPDTKVLWQSHQEPYIVDTKIGRGHVIFGASERLLSNAFLADSINLNAMLQILAPGGQTPGHLFFEESHHGFSAFYAMARLLGHPGLRFAGMLALLGVLAYFGTSLVRFGPIVPLRPETGRSTLEFVDSIADLYLRADLRNDTIKYLFIETHQRVLHRLNLPPTAPHDIIASRLQQAHPHLPKWKKLAQRFDSRDYTDGLPPSGWMRVARDLIEIKSAMA